MLRRWVPAGAVLRGRAGLRVLRPPPPASSQSTAPPRVRPAPRRPRPAGPLPPPLASRSAPCPAGGCRAQKLSFSVTDTSVHLVPILPTLGTPRPRRTRAAIPWCCGETPPRRGCRPAGLSGGAREEAVKATSRNFQSRKGLQGLSLLPTTAIPEEGVPSTAAATSKNHNHILLLGKEAVLSQLRIYTREQMHLSRPAAPPPLPSSIPPALWRSGFSPRKGTFPMG